MSSLITLAKHPLIWCVFFLAGFIGGMWFQDHYGSPRTVQAVTIQKQKVKGDGNAYTNEFEMNQVNGMRDQEKEQKKNGFIRRIFRRRKNESDSAVDRTGESH